MGRPRRDEQLPLVDEKGRQKEEKNVERSAAGSPVAGAVLSVVACLVYLSVGPALILVNRHILKEVGFNFPMALSGLGLVGASLSSFVLMKVCRVVEPRQSHLITPQFVLLNLAPIGAAMSATLACGNAVYLFLPVGFIQMLKAFTPTVTLLMLCLLRVEMPSPLVSLTVIGMCAGTAAATLGAAQLNVAGLLIMLASETAEALRLVLTQKLLQNNNFGVCAPTPAARYGTLSPESWCVGVCLTCVLIVDCACGWACCGMTARGSHAQLKPCLAKPMAAWQNQTPGGPSS
jgi:hypothetical protein